MISGKTTLLPLFGYPTEAFKAPLIYNPWFESKGIDSIVVPLGVKPEDFAAVFRAAFMTTNIPGALVTMPHKIATVSLLDAPAGGLQARVEFHGYGRPEQS